MDADKVVPEANQAMKKIVEYMNHEFANVRTGKASPAIVEGLDIHVPSYNNAMMKLKELAVITTPEPRLIMVQPFDPSVTHDIEKGIRESKLGINPAADGKIIRLPIPELSEERRVELSKVIKGMAEETRVRVRASRKDALDKVKVLHKDKEITEDDVKLYEKDIQELTDKFVKEIDEHTAAKEKELMTV